MTPLNDVLRVLGLFALSLCMLTFGIMAGWFTLKAFNGPERRWELQAIIFAVFFPFVALLAWHTTPGALGAFLLGTSGAFLFWGVLPKQRQEEEEAE